MPPPTGLKASYRLLRNRWRAAVQTRCLRAASGSAIEADVGRFAYMGFGATIGWVHGIYLAREILGGKLTFLNPEQWPFGARRPQCALDRFIQLPGAQVRSGEPDPHALQYVVNLHAPGGLRDWGYYDELTWPTCAFGHKPQRFDSLDDYRRWLMPRTYQPTPFAWAMIEPQLGFLPERFIAWHIRRGDKTAGPWKEDEVVPLEKYRDATLLFLAKDTTAPRHVVVCTDSPDAVTQARQIASTIPGGMEVVFDAQEKRWDGYCGLHRTGKIDDVDDMVTEVLTAQKNIEIMRRADYLIGCNSSCLFRVASLLRPDQRRITSLSENKVYKKWYPI